jgi:hypothetical protein
VIADNSAVATDKGRLVSGAGIPDGSFVGKVTDTPQTATSPSGSVDTGSFQLVDSSGQAVNTIGPVSGVSLSARTPATDPLFNATSATNGGGDTGSVLISPFIKPGTVSTRWYNHYSWLRTMEDLFAVSQHSRGLDGKGHIGYAAQPGLTPFGTDIFTNPSGHHTAVTTSAVTAGTGSPAAGTPAAGTTAGHKPWGIAVAAALLLFAAVPATQIRRKRRQASGG